MPQGSPDDSLPLLAARLCAAQSFPAALYVVATPLGNLADITLRALAVLGQADCIACEDTRHSAALLQHFGIHKPLIALHEHNEISASAMLIERLQAGQRVAYISDAGTPALSDPGAVLASAVQRAGLRVIPIPGASSLTAALSVAGAAGTTGNTAGFTFLGFLPAAKAARTQILRSLPAGICVLFEAPHRLKQSAADLAEHCPARTLTLCREMTKLHEEIATLSAAELLDWLQAKKERVQGESVIVLHGATAAQATAALSAEEESSLREMLGFMPAARAAALLAKLTPHTRDACYRAALGIKAEQEG